MTMCRASARQITNPCTSAQSYWSNNTIEPLSNNYETKHFRNCQAGDRHGTPRVQIRGKEASLGELVYASKRRHTVEIANIGENNAYMAFPPARRQQPRVSVLHSHPTSLLRSFRREKHKPSQLNSIWTCQRNDFSRRQTASWTKWSPSESTRTTTTTFTSQAISSPPPSAPVWRRWCVVSSQVDFLVSLPRSSVRGDGR